MFINSLNYPVESLVNRVQVVSLKFDLNLYLFSVFDNTKSIKDVINNFVSRSKLLDKDYIKKTILCLKYVLEYTDIELFNALCTARLENYYLLQGFEFRENNYIFKLSQTFSDREILEKILNELKTIKNLNS